MNYLPYEGIAFKSKLPSSEILRLVQENITRSKGSGSMGMDRSNSYYGKITGQSFHLERKINYRNSFLPEIKGEVSQVENESIINIEMRLSTVVSIFLIIWLGGAIIGIVVFLLESIREGQLELSIFGPILMFIFGYVLAMGGFGFESSKTKNYLAKLFEVETKE
jgi:hypothetical protein